MTFSYVSTGFHGQSLAHTTAHTAFTSQGYENRVDMQLGAVAAPGLVTFNGSGSIAKDYGTPLNLSSGQYTIPAEVPLDKTVHEWRVPGTGSTVRLFVGSIPGKPDIMRVCFRIEIPGALRVSCTRHLRSDGSSVGADAGHDIDGKIYTHASNDDEQFPRKVHFCSIESGDHRAGTREVQSRFTLLEFSAPNIFRDRQLYHTLTTDGVFPSTTQPLGDGTFRVDFGWHRVGRTLTRRGNSIESFATTFGYDGSFANETCRVSDNL